MTSTLKKERLATFLGEAGYYQSFIAGDLRTREIKIARRANFFVKELFLQQTVEMVMLVVASIKIQFLFKLTFQISDLLQIVQYQF